ncbi:hypothetical protein A2164_02000 [Candidatus Curtissbacteria bacterium RBG_13_35_7]|uniref:Glycosyltransferase n=1 Tax=Candidatus Curtissbacteria bacterium RBG_13_35_7 TaxID=1797705 RepID=A0A1F5G2Y4_9BACT|nr:MAG: hypothetical protein A2164_02000 [Candidatus Curtissbacteria bacterium RBG_13_35_7]
MKRQKINIIGVNVNDLLFDEAVDEVLKLAEAKNRGRYVVTVNSEFVMLARRDPKFRQILDKADLALADGQWVVNSKLILGGKEHNRITGVDLLENVCKVASDKAIRIGFLGGFGDVAKTVAKCQKNLNPRLKVVISMAGNPIIGYDLRLIKEFDMIGRVDVLFVAYGMGQQEFWIDRMRKKLNVGVFIGVGGAFDYLAGVKKRAPVLIQKMGLEWFWRLILDPARIWRMRVLPIFLVLVFLNFLKNNIKSKFTK